MIVLELCAADRLRDALQRLAAHLLSVAQADQVWIGLHRIDRASPSAGWPVTAEDLKPQLREALAGAMDEAFEQGVAVASPPLDTAAVCMEQQAWQRHVGRSVATLPLGRHGHPLLAVTLERARPFDADELASLVAQLDGVAGLVRWIQQADRPWSRVALDALRQRFARWRDPEVRWQRRAAVAAVVLLAVTLVPVEDRVRGAARIEGEQQRVMPAPTDGFVKAVHARPGDQVHAGDPLLDLLDADQRLERDRLAAQLAQHENAYASAMAKSERVAAATALARAAEAQAQLDLAEAQLARSRLVAPFDALVIQGDWSQQIGAPVRQGDALLTLATHGRQRVVIEIDEIDIERVRTGQQGRLSLAGWAWHDEPLVVERIAPMARAVNGRNVFDVQARLAQPAAELRPGLIGRGELVAGRSPWLWAVARDVVLRARLTVWRWFA